MGLFKKMQEGLAGAMPSTDPDAVAAQQRAVGIDPGNFGGPSNAPVADDDPIWAPIEGVDLATYARLVKIAQGQGVTDEAGMAAVAQAEGIDPAAWSTAASGWIARMGQNMAVGQKFKQLLDAS